MIKISYEYKRIVPNLNMKNIKLVIKKAITEQIILIGKSIDFIIIDTIHSFLRRILSFYVYYHIYNKI